MSDKNLIEIKFDLPNKVVGIHKTIRKAAKATLETVHPGQNHSVSILVCEDEQIQELNKTYRGVDRPTDVLSFSDVYSLPGSMITHIGDIVISFPTAYKQSQASGNSIESEVSLLTIHGVLHLLGFDHLFADEKRRMWDIQNSMLESLGYFNVQLIGDEPDA